MPLRLLTIRSREFIAFSCDAVNIGTWVGHVNQVVGIGLNTVYARWLPSVSNYHEEWLLSQEYDCLTVSPETALRSVV